GKVFLASQANPLAGHCPSSDGVVDYVLWGSAACSAPTAPALEGSTADLRANGGCIDTDNCAADFASGIPVPRNTGVSHGCTAGPDCNGNGVDDTAELASGALTDVNGNSVADACEGAVTAECDISA